MAFEHTWSSLMVIIAESCQKLRQACGCGKQGCSMSKKILDLCHFFGAD